MPETKQYHFREALDFLHARGLDSLTCRQLRVLLACRNSIQTVRGLAGWLGISKPAVTRACDRLAEEGFLRRETDKADKRSVNLHLTHAGNTLAANFE